MGPLRLTDSSWIGCLEDIFNLQHSFNDDRYAPPLLEQMVEEGNLERNLVRFFDWN